MIQKRNIAMYIILSIVTCGIFGIYWFICLTDDSKLAANDNESASGPVAFLLTIVTCGYTAGTGLTSLVTELTTLLIQEE